MGVPLLFGCLISKNSRWQERLAVKRPAYRIRGKGIWIHALSVGEVRSALPLVRKICEQYPHKELVFSATTVQGLNLARKELKGIVTPVLCMPLDIWWASDRITRWVNPELFVLMETDLWPGILARLRAMGTKAMLVNGRISESTFNLYRKAPFLARRLFADLDYCLMQSPLDTERLLDIGVPGDKVVTIGNIKFDHDWVSMETGEKLRWMNLFGLSDNTLIWVAGSTHGEESDLVLEVYCRLLQIHPNLTLILAPRKIEEAPRLVSVAKEKGLRCVRRSQTDGNVMSPQVIVLDTIGELNRIYGLGHLSFVGGSLVPFGGHNLLEPASFGIPVVFGPHTQNFVWMAQALERSKGGLRVKTPEELFSLMCKLIRDPELRVRTGECARAFVLENRGALNRTMEYVYTCLEGKGVSIL